jgi:hypothetical protein
MKTIKYKDVVWLYKQGALIPLLPPHKTVVLNDEDKKQLLKISQAYFIRYNSSFDIKQCDFWYIIKDSYEDLNLLSSNMRNQIRRAQKSYFTKLIDKRVMIESAYSIYLEASKRYETFEKIMTEEEFIQYIGSLNDKYDFWGVFEYNTEKLVAYSQNFIDGQTCFYEEIFSTPESLKNYSSYVLFFDMNSYYMNNKKFTYVHDGSRSLSHNTSIHEFLETKFRFRKAYSKMDIVYRSDIGIIVKLLYPLRNIIKKINYNIFKKITVLLNHEEIRRSFE